MKAKLLLFMLTMLSGFEIYAQTDKCGTMQNLAEMLLQNPALQSKMDSMEAQTQRWTETDDMSRMKYFRPQKESSIGKAQSLSPQSLCGYDNTLFTTIAGPSALNQTVSPAPNCTYGGEFVRVTGLIKGRIYRISTCGVNNFDTQISIYTAGGGQAVAHNDDWCGLQSEIYFNPLANGSYDILIDEINCLDNTLCASLEIQLAYIPRPVITIPVVVHVIHFGEALGVGRNISAAQINSQIDALNEDFRRTNSNINTTPAAFRGGSDDALVEFCLASQDEFGNPTTGIVRYLGSQPEFSTTDLNTSIKPTTIWDRDSYLNIWTCDLPGGLLGYAQFPGQDATTDGVVMQYDAFGRIGNVSPPYHLGRTTSHEVGHWLNLRHIWGDELACDQDDFVTDTPLQAGENYGDPIFPLLDACYNYYPGVMFCNFMDYTNDATKSMVTVGQTTRMDAALAGPRLSLSSSNGCQISAGSSQIPLSNSIKLYPNPSNGIFTIQSNEQLIDSEFKIVNSIGQVVYESKIASMAETVNLTEFSSGLYFVHITAPSGVISKKILLNHQD